MTILTPDDVAGETSLSRARRPAFNGLRQILWLLTPSGAVESFNPFWSEYTGLPSVIEGLAWSEVIHPEDRQRLVNARTLGVASEAPYEVEARMRRRDGVYRRHLCRVTPLREEGELIGWLGTAIDVEDVRAAEDAARASERRKQKVLQSINEGYYRLDRLFRLVEVNDAFERMTGKRRDEVLGRNLWTVFANAPPASAYLSVPFRGVRTEERYSHSIDRWAEVTIYRSEDGFEAYFRDIGVRKRAELRQRAVADLCDRMRGLDDVPAIVEAGSAVIGASLGLVRAGYAAVDGDFAVIAGDWVASAGERRLSGRFRIADWGSFAEDLSRGELAAIEDLLTDPRTAYAADRWQGWSLRGAAFVPLMYRGRLEAFMLLHASSPRRWPADELDFVRIVCDGIWSAMQRVG